ncbi:flagellar biosynthesis anti-sigma factor FlgM [Agaribacterium sp. ZY112]|uniref:flagellar biosynthesis anti-sigma factor FlgM n=1 Tax=Agaribacterium sp. ZY112 TaxID=3233574 RepID=UPI0035238BBC
MVIDPNSINNASGGPKSRSSGVQRQETNASSSAASSAPKEAKTASDSVTLSNTAQSMSKLEIALAEVPEIDNARVAEIREALQNGQYKIDADAIASKMLEQGM